MRLLLQQKPSAGEAPKYVQLMLQQDLLGGWTLLRETGQIGGKAQNSSQWQAHYYIYPLLYWMEILTDFLCFEQTTFDVAYVTELDPLWQDSALTSILNPEVALFANPAATAACAADCVASTAKLPIDQL